MATATQERAAEAGPERQKQNGYSEGFVEFRMFEMAQDIRDLRTHIYNMDSRLNSRIDQLGASLNSRMDKTDTRMDRIEARIDKIDDRLWLLLLGVALSILVPILLRFL